MQLDNTYDNEPVTVTSGTDCARHRSTQYCRPGAGNITCSTRSVHANGTDRYVNEWEVYHHMVVRTGPPVCAVTCMRRNCRQRSGPSSWP